MKKGILAICLVLVLLVAASGLSCPADKGTIEVKATLDGAPWTGSVDYTLSRTGETVTGASVDKTFTVAPDTWTCAYVSGGPGLFVDITPSPTQSVAAGGTITFTLNFVTPPTPVDASIEFDSWTINGMRVDPGWYVVGPGDWIDIEYKEHVSGEEDAVVRVDQTNWLQVHNIGYEGEIPGPPIKLHCVDHPNAVRMDPPATKLYQQCTVEGNPVVFCHRLELEYCEPVNLDVETGWELVVCNNYTKTINWIGFPVGGTMILDLNGLEVLWDVEEIEPFMAFNLTDKACIEVGDGFEDTNPDNDCTDWCPPLIIIYAPPPL